MKNLICMMSDAGADGTWLIIVMVAFLAIMLLTSFIPQKKRQKEMMNMLSSLKVDDEIKTIGGMVGKIVKVEDNGLLVLNVGTEENPTFIKIDRVAIYSVAKKPEEIVAVEDAPANAEPVSEPVEEKAEDKAE